MTDQEINEAVAKALGWKQKTTKYSTFDGQHDSEVIRKRVSKIPDYANSIGAAWEVVEAIGAHFNGLHREWDSGDWYVKLYDGALRAGIKDGEWYEDGPSDPIPAKAICLAFLKLKDRAMGASA